MLFYLTLCFSLSLSDKISPSSLFFKVYSGSWSLTSGTFFNFTQTTGLIRLHFEFKENQTVELTLRNGPYMNDLTQELSFIDTEFLYSDLTLISKSSNSYVPHRYRKNCTILFEAKSFPKKHTIEGNLTSEDCDFSIEFCATKGYGNMYGHPRKVYSILLFFVGFFQSYFISKFLEILATDANTAKRSSLATWMIYSSIDFSIVIFNIGEMIRDQHSLENMIMGLVWSMISFYTVSSKLLFIIFNAQNTLPTAELTQSHLFSLMFVFCKFYTDSIMTTINILAYQITILYLLQIPVCLSFFIPQILKSARQNMPSPLPAFISISLFTSRAFLLYMFIVSSYNPLQIRPLFKFYFCCAVFLALQLMFVLIQAYFPRFFVPKFCLPKPYEYLKDLEHTSFKECSICLGEELQTKVMQAPCGHLFHQECLTKWLTIQLVCPMCRKALPPFENI